MACVVQWRHSGAVGTIHNFEKMFIERMTARGYEREFVESCFNQIRGFGEYGFPESHAASFANLVYVSCWMKCYYPDVFAAALLNSQPMGFYAPAQIVRDAREHGVEVRPVDVNFSDWDCTLENDPAPRGVLQMRHASMNGHIRTTHAMRLGFRQISGLSEDHALRIEIGARARLRLGARSVAAHAAAALRAGAARQCGCVRLARPLAPRCLVGGARAAARRRQGRSAAVPPRRHAGARAGHRSAADAARRAGGRGLSPPASLAQGAPRLVPAWRARPPRHPRHELLPGIRNGERVTVAGLVLVRQRPGTAKGVIFMTLEDETGIANTIVWARAFETYRPVVIGARLVAVTGPLQSASGVIHVVMEHIEDLTPLLRRLSDDHECVGRCAHADEARRPPVERHRHPRAGDSLVTALKEAPALVDELTAATARVMPKGRNFH